MCRASWLSLKNSHWWRARIALPRRCQSSAKLPQSMLTLRSLLAAIGTAAVVACRGGGESAVTPTAPTAAPALLTAGEYTFTAVGGPSCANRGVSGTVGVRVRVMASKTGSTWTLRTVDTSDGDLLIRLVERPHALGPTVDGDGSGTAVDRSGQRARGMVSLTFAGPAAGAAIFSGALISVDIGSGLLGAGQASGSFVEAREGGSATCEQIRWSVER